MPIGGANLVKKRGRPEVDDFAVFLRMKEMQEARPGLSDRAAAAEIAARLGGITSTHVDRLRKRFGRLKRAGKLPPALERAVAEIRWHAEHLKGRIAKSLAIEEADQERDEREAGRLGLPVRGPELAEAILALQTEWEDLYYVTGDPGSAWIQLMHKGITEPDEVAETYKASIIRFDEVDRNLTLLKALQGRRGRINLLRGHPDAE